MGGFVDERDWRSIISKATIIANTARGWYGARGKYSEKQVADARFRVVLTI